jgi:hypothetical protein
MLVGAAGFLQLGHGGGGEVGYRHFVLAQPVGGGIHGGGHGGSGHGGGEEGQEYRWVGTMHCVEGGALGDVVERELGVGEVRRVVLG